MESHLLQMRGLKHHTFVFISSGGASHLLQMRGLKLLNGKKTYNRWIVASFTDAWIETGIFKAS